MKTRQLFLFFFLLFLPAWAQGQAGSLNVQAKQTDSTTIENQINAAISFGGENKFAILLPRVDYTRIHHFQKISPYYGVGFHFNWIMFPFYSANTNVGLAYKNFTIESSLSYFIKPKVNLEEVQAEKRGPFSQLNLTHKIGYRYKDFWLKIGVSSNLKEYLPPDQIRSENLYNFKTMGNAQFNIEFLMPIKHWRSK